MFEINKRRNDQTREEETINERQRRRLVAKGVPACEKCQAGQEFHQEITYGDWRTAVPALPTKPKPGHQRDVEIPGNRIFAVRAMRGRRHNALSQRKAMNTDIQEASNVTAEYEEDDRPEMKRHPGPDLGIEGAVEKSRRGQDKWREQTRSSRFVSHL